MAVHKFSVDEGTKKKVEKKVVTPAKAKKTVAKKADVVRAQRAWTKPFRRFGGYFAGAWTELSQVHWPNRKATWELTLAVIVFSLVLGAVIFLLDWGFTYLFKEVIL